MILNINDLYKINNGATGEEVANGIHGNFSMVVGALNTKMEWTSSSTVDYPDRKSILFSVGDTLSLSDSGGIKDFLYANADGELLFGEESLKLGIRTSDSAIGVHIFGSDTVRYLAYKDEISSTYLVGTLSIPSYFIEDGYDVVYYPAMTEEIFNSLLNIVSIDGQVYYLNEQHDGTFGRMLTGWQNIDGNTYYLNPVSDGTQGAMYYGLRTIDGKNYYFNEAHDGTFGKLLFTL